MRSTRFKKLKTFINDKKKTTLIFQILYAIGALFILYMIKQNWNQFVLSISQIKILYIIIPFFLYPLGMIPSAVAWHFLVKLIDRNRILIKDFYLYNLSIFSRHIPGYVWFLGSRSLIYKEENISSVNTIFLTLLETILLSITGFVMAIPLLWSNRYLFPDNTFVLILIFCSLMIFALLLLSLKPSKLLMSRLSKKILSEEFIIPQLKNNNLLFSIISMILAWIGGGILLLFVIRSFIPVQIGFVLFASGIWGFAGAVSLSLGLIVQGLGIREITTALLLSIILTPLQAATASVIFRLLLTVGEIFWVLVFTAILKNYYKSKVFKEK